MAVVTKDNGRSIPDNDLDMIDRVWGDEIPEVKKAVQKLWGVPVPDAKAMAIEQEIATLVHDYTIRGGKPLSAKEARILLNLASCIDIGVYGVGVEWADVAGSAKLMGLSEGHVRRMLIDDKITVRMVRRPSSGNLAEKRWLKVEDLVR